MTQKDTVRDQYFNTVPRTVPFINFDNSFN